MFTRLADEALLTPLQLIAVDGKVAGLLGSVHADRHRTNPCYFKPLETVLNAPQLGVA